MKTLLLCLALALPVAAADIDRLRWMSGRWSATIDGVEMEEIWTTPRGGMLLGLHRDVSAKRTSFEFMRIEQTKDGIAFIAQPSGRAATLFPLLEATARRVVFANPQHDFPQRIIYELRDAQLCARVEGEGNAAEEWCWNRRAESPASSCH
jgi:hypothetical protein